MKKSDNLKKKDSIKSLINGWKKMDSQKKLLIVVFFLVFVFIICMPNLYKGWVGFRDYNFGSKNKLKLMTCTQVHKDKNYETNINVQVYYSNDKLRKDNYVMTMKAVSQMAKDEIASRKELYNEAANLYNRYKGFKVSIDLKKDKLTYKVVTDYTEVDYSKVNQVEEGDNPDSITIPLKLNDDINTVKEYYEGLGLTCKK